MKPRSRLSSMKEARGPRKGDSLEARQRARGVCLMQDRIGGSTKSECQKGEGEGRHDEPQQEASLTAQSQTTGRGSTAGYANHEPVVAAGCCKRRNTQHASEREICCDLTGKSANWFRFQDAEQKVKRLGFLLQQECSQARRGGTRQGNPRGG
jgi:hypothetical protein